MRKITWILLAITAGACLAVSGNAASAQGSKAATPPAPAPASVPAPVAKATPTASAFDQLVDDFVLGTLALSPTTATGQGYHEHKGVNLDDVLDDLSPAGIEASLRLDRDIQARIDKLNAAALDPEQRADVDMMRDALAASRLDLEDIQSYRHNPTVYVEMLGNGLYSPYVLHYAPALERFRHIISRLTKVAELVRQAEANLQDAPKIWNQVAREENSGNIALIDATLRSELSVRAAHAL